MNCNSGFFGCGNNAWWIILLILFFCCGGCGTATANNGCGCDNGCGC